MGGASVARHQLVLALSLGCEKIVVLGRSLSPGMVALQHEAERAGARFHAISATRQLSGLVTADDDLIVFADGLLVDQNSAIELLKDRPAVLVQPVDSGLAAGFERIDLNHAAAGAMRIPGHTVERLTELPADCDVVSALTRIALQGGIVQKRIPTAALAQGMWAIVRSDVDAQEVEGDWLASRIDASGRSSPIGAIGRWLVRRFGPALLSAANGTLSLHIASWLSLMLAVVAGWFGISWLAFGFIGLGAILRHATTLLRRLDLAVSNPQAASRRELLFAWGVDAIIVFVVIWNLPRGEWLATSISAFAPVMLVLTLRNVAAHAGQPLAAWLGDRLVLVALLSVLAVSGWLLQGIMFTAIAISGWAIFDGKAASRFS